MLQLLQLACTDVPGEAQHVDVAEAVGHFGTEAAAAVAAEVRKKAEPDVAGPHRARASELAAVAVARA